MDDVHDGASVFESQGLDDSVGIVEPEIGMSFGSEEEVRMFYSKYAMSQGFGIAKISVKCDDNGSLKYYSLACSRNGKYVSLANNGLNPRPTIKIGCKAKINIVVRSEGEFVISKVCIPHNHSLSPQSSRYLPCHRRLDSMTKRVLEINDRAGIKPSKSYVSLVVAAGGYEQVKYGEKDVRNYLAKARDYRLGIGDAEAVCTYFKRMQIRNPNFFYVIDLDKDGRLRNLFWADARSRAAYESFSDVVSFDSTYLTNEYRMPFAPFIGVNHHGQSILFGCGLLSFEGVEGYIWLFRSWLECMSFNAPKAIITDQCKSIQAAVAEVFPDTRYRLCLWHIMRKIPIKFGAFKEYKKIKKCLKAVVYESITVNEFEQGWAQLLCDFELGENDWLKSLYDDRKRWVPVFVKEMFWAGMSTTQRSESMNAFFDGYLNSKTTLKQFVEQYDEALKKKIENENIADFSSFNSTIPLITDFEFEKQFQNAYTHDMFRKFQAEIRGMICCNVSLLGSEWHVSTYQVCDVAKGKDGKERKVLYNVLFSEVEFEVLCLCHLFEFKGIVCRHILKVLLERNIRELPGEYILDRWRKCIKRNHNYVKNCYEDLVTKEEMVRQSSLYTIFCQISDAAVKSIEKYEFLRENLEILHEKMSTLEFNVDDGDTIPCEDGCSRLRIRSPLKVRSKGRPPVKRKESRIYRLSNKGKKSGNCSKDVVGVDK